MSRRYLVHPRRSRLEAWLDADDLGPGDRLTAHLETCGRCASRLDEIVLGEAVDFDFSDMLAADVDESIEGTASSGPGDGGRSAVAAVLRDAWSVPDELPTRIHRAIDERARADQELDLLLGLVSLGKDTAELLLPAEPDDTPQGAEEGPPAEEEPT